MKSSFSKTVSQAQPLYRRIFLNYVNGVEPRVLENLYTILPRYVAAPRDPEVEAAIKAWCSAWYLCEEWVMAAARDTLGAWATVAQREERLTWWFPDPVPTVAVPARSGKRPQLAGTKGRTSKMRPPRKSRQGVGWKLYIEEEFQGEFLSFDEAYRYAEPYLELSARAQVIAPTPEDAARVRPAEEPLRHFDWLARWQLGLESHRELANRHAISVWTVRAALSQLARDLGLTPRSKQRPTNPRVKTSRKFLRGPRY